MQEELKELIKAIRSSGIDHDVLTTYTVVEGVAENATPIRVGKGRGELGEVDIPILRDHTGTPYIPGSSIKGSSRAFLEALARGSGLNVCTPFNSSICSFGAELLNFILQKALTTPTLEDLRKLLLESRGVIEEIARRRAPAIATQIVEELMTKLQESDKAVLDIVNKYRPCIICRLFGNQALAARTVFFDMYPEDRSSIRTAIRTRVAIDRLREAARSGALFEYEFIPPGYRWRFRMEVKNVDIVESDSEEAKLLRSFFKHFAEFGLSIGGMKSVGHGLLRLIPEETYIAVYRTKDLSIVLTKRLTLNELLKGAKP